MWRASGPCLPRRAPSYGAALLHQFGVARFRARPCGWRGGPDLNVRVRVVSWALLLSTCACARHPLPPGPGTVRGVAPDLRGLRVMLLPVQRVVGAVGDADAELAFAMQARGPQVIWVLPAALDSDLVRAPTLQTRTHDLPVDQFLAAEVKRVGDPLYGDLRRLGAVANSNVALVPVQAAAVDSAGGQSVRLWAALLDVRTGYVLWFGIVQGDRGGAGDPRVLASAADKLARTLLRSSTG